MDKLTLSEVKELLNKNELTSSDIARILISTSENHENISLFNEWAKQKYNYSSPCHGKIVLENIDIRNIDLSGIDLRYSEIINCSFSSCNFSEVSLWDARINNCSFSWCDFSGANLRGSLIFDTKFSSTSFSGRECFIETVINNTLLSIESSNLVELDFTHSNLRNVIITVPTTHHIENEYTSINPIGLDGHNPVSEVSLHSLNFSYSTLQNVRIVNLKIFNIILTHASISHSDIVNTVVTNRFEMVGISLNNVRVKTSFFNKYLLDINQLLKSNKVTPENYETVSVIRDNFKEINNSRARTLYNQLEKNILRLQYLNDATDSYNISSLKKIGSYLSLTFLKWVSSYGESPSRILFWIVSIIILVGFSSYVFNWTCEDTLLKNMYFSIITFSTVGYGDISPSNDFGRFVLALEGLAGIFFMSMFVVSLAKKWLDD